jgi:hypothetical protein
MCGVVPTPPDPKLSLPGCAFASAMSSATEWAATLGLTTSTSGEVPASPIPAKSRDASSVYLR